MTFKLYPKQQEKAEILLENFKTKDFMFMTGEVGVGKTYIGTYVLLQWQKENPDKHFLVISPKQVIAKWKKVLAEAGVDMANVTVKSTFNAEDVNKSFAVIYDEIHEIKTKVKHFSDFVETHKKVLGLTGSIIDKSVRDITNITNAFSNKGEKFPQYKDVSVCYHDMIAYARLFIEPVMTVGLSKDDVIETNDDDAIIIDTYTKSIAMNDEESAFYDFMSGRLAKLQISPDQRMRVLNESLDRVPGRTEFIQKTNRNTNEDGTIETVTNSYFIGEKLHKTKSKKDYIVSELLETYDKRTLIYTFDNSVAKRIAESTEAVFVDTSKRETAEAEINEKLEQSAVVINISNILTGVDLHADTIIWYQTPISLVQDVQGVGRITRLSSSRNDKKVIYLYHENTMQETQTKALQENHKLNNEMIAKKDKSKMGNDYFPFGLSRN